VIQVRLGLALAGFVVALLAIALEDQRLTWGAIALLTAAVILRLLDRKRGGNNSGDMRL
jgi:hypothetical protein